MGLKTRVSHIFRLRNNNRRSLQTCCFFLAIAFHTYPFYIVSFFNIRKVKNAWKIMKNRDNETWMADLINFEENSEGGNGKSGPVWSDFDPLSSSSSTSSTPLVVNRHSWINQRYVITCNMLHIICNTLHAFVMLHITYHIIWFYIYYITYDSYVTKYVTV